VHLAEQLHRLRLRRDNRFRRETRSPFTFSTNLYSTRLVSAADFSASRRPTASTRAALVFGSFEQPGTASITTTQPGDLLAAGYGAANTPTFTPAFPFTALSPTSAALGSVTRSIYSNWWIAPNGGSYKTGGTLSAARVDGRARGLQSRPLARGTRLW